MKLTIRNFGTSIRNSERVIRNKPSSNIMKKLSLLFFCIFLFIDVQNIKAAHIVGGEMTYECIGNNRYEIRLIVYRDCIPGPQSTFNTNTPFDNPASIYVFDENNTQPIDGVTVFWSDSISVEPPQSICIETLPDVCLAQATYRTTITLPNTAGNYTVVYQRYSRNGTIANILGPDDTGSSYLAVIPHPGGGQCQNSSPIFVNTPPTVICANTLLRIPFPATDTDGDSLVYSLCAPIVGGSQTCPAFRADSEDPFDPCRFPPPPPYDIVNWRAGYSASNPLGGNTPLAIDPQTGLLTGTPTNMGQYVVGVCVTDYRNGQALSTVRRDLQFNVTDCKVVEAAIEEAELTADGTYLLTDCQDFLVNFRNTSIGATSYQWNFGDPSASEADNISNEESPNYTYPSAGTYNVTLIAEPSEECTDTAFIEVKIYPTLVSNFDYTPVCASEATPFTDMSSTNFGNVNSWNWDFGDEGTSDVQNPTHEYGVGGMYTVTLTTTTDLGCIHTMSREIEVYPAPKAEVSIDAICIGVPTNFSTQITGATASNITWNFGDSNSANNTATTANASHTYQNIGDYTATLTVESNNGCVDVFTENFTIYPAFTAEITPSTPEICEGDNIELTANPADVPNIAYTYNWSPSDLVNSPEAAKPIATPTSTTTFQVTVTDPNGCISTTQTTVTVHATPRLTLMADTQVCAEESITLEPTDIANNIASFEWTGPSLNETANLSPSISPTATGIYVLHITDENGCENTDSVRVEVVPFLNPTISEDVEICSDETPMLNAGGGETYSWSPTIGLSNPNIANPVASIDVTTTYTVTISNSCFSEEQSVTVTVDEAPEVDAGLATSINVGEFTVLNGSGDGTLTWSPTVGLETPNSGITTAEPLQTTLYTLTARNENGCEAVDTVSIKVTNFIDVLVPTAFTPNEDGMNDVFQVIDTRGIKEITAFSIYDRWGKPVFVGSANELEWDGYVNGKPQDVGIYVYYIKTITALDEEKVWEGVLSLIR